MNAFVRDMVRSPVLAMSPTTNSITVGTAAVEAKTGVSQIRRSYLKVAKIGNGIVYWGGASDVTVSTGFPLFAENDVIEFRFIPGTYIPIYLIASQNIEVRIAEW